MDININILLIVMKGMHMKKRRKKLVITYLLIASLAFSLFPNLKPLAKESDSNVESDTSSMKPLKLQYNAPADKGKNERDNWESWALPVGNGHMGAMVFGRTETERIQLNEKTLWSGGTGGTDSAPGGEYEKRDPLSDAYGNVDANTTGAMTKYIDQLFEKYYSNSTDSPSPSQDGDMKLLPNNRSSLGDYQNFAEMRLDFGHKNTNVKNYKRELDLRSAMSTVNYTYNSVNYSREMFADHSDNIMVYHLTADKPDSLSFVLRPEIADLGATKGGHNKVVKKNGTVISDQDSASIVMEGTIENNGMKFAGIFKIVNNGGIITAANPEVKDFPQSKGQITVENANSVDIYIALATNYKNKFPDYRQEEENYAIENATNRIDKAVEYGYEKLRSNHLTDYQNLFSRVELNLGGVYNETENTDSLLSKWRTASANGSQNHYLEELYYQYGRYMLIASSREDTLPNNLQGIWNDRAFPDWQSDYHTNINIQMNYWPAFSTNLPETGIALVNYVDSLREPGELTASNLYGTENAWMVNCSANALGFTGNINSNASLASTANAFILQNAYDYYQFTQDKEMLENTIYPLMTEACNFFFQVLQPGRTDKDKDKLFMAPSFSSEQGPWTIGATFDQQLIYLLFEDTLDASKQLGIESDFTKQLEDKMRRLYPANIGESGQIKEWQNEGKYNTYAFNGQKIADPNHRHNSQLMLLHPGHSITTENQPLMEAAKTTLTLRGDGATGWSMGQKFNMWARLQDGNHAYNLLFKNLMKNGTATNLFDLHPPFQIDGNFGGTAGLTELLLQSHAGYLSILPAIPDELSNGSVKGLVAEGNFVVNLDWANKKPTNLEITSQSGNRISLKTGVIREIIDVTNNMNVNDISQDANGAVSFDTTIGHTYKIVMGSEESLLAVKDMIKQVEIQNIDSRSYTTETAKEFEEAFNSCKRMVEQGNYVQSDVSKTAARLEKAVNGLERRPGEQSGPVLALNFLEKASAQNYKGTDTEDQWRQEIEYAREDLLKDLLNNNEDSINLEEKADELVKTGNSIAGYDEARIQLYDLLKKAKKIEQGERSNEAWKAYQDALDDIATIFANPNADKKELISSIEQLKKLIATIDKVYEITISVVGSGEVLPNRNITVIGGSDQKISFVPEAGSEVLDVLHNGKSVGILNEYIIRNIKEDQTIEVIYTKSTQILKSQEEIIIENGLKKANSLDKAQFTTESWNALQAAVEAAGNVDKGDNSALKEASTNLLSALDSLKIWGEANRTEAESSTKWPIDNYSSAIVYKDPSNWGEKNSDGEKIVGGYSESGPKGGNSGGSPNGEWSQQSIANSSNGQQMFTKSLNSWVKFNFNGKKFAI